MSTIQRVRTYLGEKKTKALRWAGLLQKDWRTGLPEEASFWARALENEGRNWNEAEYRERMNPELPLQPELRALISAESGAVVRILDVGSGPLTRVGRLWPDRKVEITATDPLAAEYGQLIDRLGLRVPVRPVKAEGERLREVFPENHFDLAYASNCLDHARNPVAAVREMLAVVKPGAFVYLWHFTNVGITERYGGLHQWNFDESDGDMTINDGRRHTSLSTELRDFCEVTCTAVTAFNCKVVVARGKKLATPPALAAAA